MDSINFVKGYNKVNHHHENQSPPIQKATTQKRLTTTVIISVILFFTIIIGLMLAASTHESKTEPHESGESPSLSSNSAEDSIKKVCSVTQYPDLCFTSISSLNISTNLDPEIIFKLSLEVSISELSNISSLFKSLYDVHSEAALRDCMSQFEDALIQLNNSLSEMEVASGEKTLTERKVDDIKTWISAGMTDQDTCLDGLEETGSKFLDEVQSKMQKSKQLLSNSLAIVANIQTLLGKFGLTMH